MSRSVLIIVIVVLVLAILGVGLVLFWQPGIFQKNRNTQANTNSAPLELNTNSAGANPNTPLGQQLLNALPKDYVAEVSDQGELDEEMNYRGAVLPLDRVEVTDGFSGLSYAEEGMKIVKVYIKKELLLFEEPIVRWLNEAQLLTESGDTYFYNRAEFHPPDDATQSYIAFSVPKDSSGFTLRLVREGEDVQVDLGI